MKPKVFFSLMLLMLSTFLHVSDTTAENEPYTQWGLPEGAKARLGKGGINDITCSSDGTLLAVATNIGIWVYDIQTREALSLLTGHTGAVDRIAFSPDGHTLASGGQDNTVRLWDVDTQTEVGTLDGHTGGPNSLFFSPDGRTLASRDDDNTLRLWDVETQTQIYTLEGYTGSVESVSFSPDGKTLASGGQDNIVRLWDVSKRTEVGTLEGHTWPVNSVVFSPDGKTLASGSGSDENTLRIWDVETRAEIGILERSTPFLRISFSPDGKTIAGMDTSSSRVNNHVDFWDVETLTRANRNRYNSLEVGGFEYRMWEVLWVVAAQTEKIGTIIWEHTESVESVSFSPDGKTIAASVRGPFSRHLGGPYFTRMWDVGTLTEINTFDWPGRRIAGKKNVSFSPDGKTILSRCVNYALCLRDAATYTAIGWFARRFSPSVFAVFSPDGHTLALLLHDSPYGESSLNYNGSPGVILWDVDTDTEIGILQGHIGPQVQSVSFSPDGRTLATAGTVDATVRLWDVATQTEIVILRGHTGWVKGVAFSPAGKTIVSGSHDGTVRLWDVETLTEIGALHGHTGWVNSVSFSPDGKTIVSGSHDGTVRLWDVATLTGKGTLEGHTTAVNSVAFSPGGKTVASGGDDGTVLLWNITSLPATQERIPEDINADGTVNIQDLVLVAANIGETEQNTADVNGDGTVNILDLTRVAGALGTVASSPANPQRNPALTPTRAQLLQWLTQARQMNRTDPTFQRGIRMLERLLAALTPKETALLANYPNPFNPETWIPYQLSKPTDVTLRIYAVDGKLVRLLDLGHQHAGLYHSRSRAAYWDGRNQIGELVASGLYFYTLTAGEFTATRKLLIRK